MDTAERDDRVMAIAAEALQKPLTERESFLRTVCRNDSDLYQEVFEVVTWEERMSTFLNRPLIDLIDIAALDKPFKPLQKVADRFDIVREIGDGGMGVVYEAYDNTRGLRIAIKCAKPGFTRLQSPELNGALKVRHPNVCQLNDIHMVSTDLGELRFITMELLDGETLLSRLSRGKLGPDEAMKIARQLCAGLAEAHRCGVVHGDLKPANIILVRGEKDETRAVITDFGLAVNQEASTILLGGTPAYMAPELKKDGHASTASDVYALGVILYEMVTGQKPFPPAVNQSGASPATPVQAKQSPARPSKLIKNLPPIWDDAILPCLALLPEKRPSAKKVIAVLERGPFYRRPWASMIVIAALLVLTAGAFFRRPIYNYFRPPDIALAILPVQSSPDLQTFGNRVLSAVQGLLAQEPRGAKKFKLVVPDAAAKKGASTLEQAQSVLPGTYAPETYALEMKLSNDPDGLIAVSAAVVELKTKAHLRDYSAHFAKSDESDLAGGLAGLVSASLHLPRAAVPETIAPAAEAAYESGKNYLLQDDYSYEQAIAQFQLAAKLDPHSPLPPAGLAEAYIIKRHSGDTQQVRDQIQNYVLAASRLNPDSPHVLLASASLNLLKGNYPQSAQDSIRAIELEPNNAEAWIHLGFADDDLKLPEQALADYQKAMELEPNYYRGYEYVGEYYYDRGKYIEAESFYAMARKLAPQRPESYANLGAMFTAQGRFPEAEKIYREILNKKETPENLNNLAATLDRQNRDSEAASLYERAIQLLPANESYRINLADSERRLGKAAEANKNYQKALALIKERLPVNPSSGLERAYMAYCLARLHKNNDAELEIREAVASDPGSQVLREAILTYEALEKRTMALDLANKATPELRKDLQHHPDLADFNHDSRFKR